MEPYGTIGDVGTCAVSRAPTDVDLGAGLQWLSIHRNSHKVKHIGARLQWLLLK
ncbi:hypothetical protein Hanom_Chr15g01395691 [Helianthus anomalus]